MSFRCLLRGPIHNRTSICNPDMLDRVSFQFLAHVSCDGEVGIGRPACRAAWVSRMSGRESKDVEVVPALILALEMSVGDLYRSVAWGKCIAQRGLGVAVRRAVVLGEVEMGNGGIRVMRIHGIRFGWIRRADRRNHA